LWHRPLACGFCSHRPFGSAQGKRDAGATGFAKTGDEPCGFVAATSGSFLAQRSPSLGLKSRDRSSVD